jgi:hypothetical protein
MPPPHAAGVPLDRNGLRAAPDGRPAASALPLPAAPEPATPRPPADAAEGHVTPLPPGHDRTLFAGPAA